MVWCRKCRRRILGGRVAAGCGQLLEQIAAEHGWEIVATEVMPDHVLLFVRVGPTDAPEQVGYVSESTVRRYSEYQCDAVAS